MELADEVIEKVNKRNKDQKPTVKLQINKLTKMSETKSIKDRVIKALERVRPYLQSDGGDIDLLDVTDDMTLK